MNNTMVNSVLAKMILTAPSCTDSNTHKILSFGDLSSIRMDDYDEESLVRAMREFCIVWRIIEYNIPVDFRRILPFKSMLRVVPWPMGLRINDFLTASEMKDLVESPEMDEVYNLYLCKPDADQRSRYQCVDKEGIRILSDALRAGKLPKLRNLTIKNGRLDPEDLVALVEGIESNKGTINSLDFSDNNITRAGALDHLARALIRTGTVHKLNTLILTAGVFKNGTPWCVDHMVSITLSCANFFVPHPVF
jgi:hypothetical protein